MAAIPTRTSGIIVLSQLLLIRKVLAQAGNFPFLSADIVAGPNLVQPGQMYTTGISKVSMVSSGVTCGIKCIEDTNCTSFNLEVALNGSSSMRCSMISVSDWKLNAFGDPAPAAGYKGQMYMRRLSTSVKPTVASVSATPPPGNVTWPTDCAWWLSRDSYLVGLRNFNDESSAMVDEIKCRQAHDRQPGGTPLRLDWDVPAVVVGRGSNECVNSGANPCPYNVIKIKCPANTIITAIHSSEPGLAAPTHIKCMKLKLPWGLPNVVGTKRCYRGNSTNPPSPLNDPAKVGTAISTWGMEAASDEIFREIVLRSSDLKYDGVVVSKPTLVP